MGAVQNFVSVSRRPPDIEDYIDILRRYRSWIVGPMFAGLVVSVVVSFLWPDTYLSTAVMRITPPTVARSLVPAENNQRISDRLNQMEQEILSRGSLTGIITQPSLDLYKKERQQRPTEDIVTDMRNKDIRIGIMELPGQNQDRSGASAFQIAFQYIDRYKAQAVVQQLVTKFMEQNVRVQQTQTKQTTQFLDDELHSAQEHLNELSAKLTDFRLKNQGRLPEQAGANATALNSVQLQMSQAQDSLSRAQGTKLELGPG